MSGAAGPGPRGSKGLVERIGGEARLRQILVRLYSRLAGDAMVGFFFAGRDLETIIDGQYRFLLRAFGATGTYDGRNPAVAHLDLPPILRGHFDRRLQILREVLDAEGLDPGDQAAWVRIEEGFRKRIQAPGHCRS